MRARRLIENSTFDPKTLYILFQAFDEAWSEIAHDFNDDPKDVERARLRLAHAVLIVAREDNEDAERIKKDALQVMALAYRHREPVGDLRNNA